MSEDLREAMLGRMVALCIVISMLNATAGRLVLSADLLDEGSAATSMISFQIAIARLDRNKYTSLDNKSKGLTSGSRKRFMRPDRVQIAQEAYATAADFIDNYINKLASTPRHIIRNHVAFEVAYRMKQGVDQKQELIALAIQAALSEIALQGLNIAEIETRSRCN